MGHIGPISPSISKWTKQATAEHLALLDRYFGMLRALATFFMLCKAWLSTEQPRLNTGELEWWCQWRRGWWRGWWRMNNSDYGDDGKTLVVTQWCRDAPASSWLRAFARIACCLAFFNLFLSISKLWEQRLCMSYGWQTISILCASGNRRFHVNVSEWFQESNKHKAKTQFPRQAQVAMRTVLRVETSLWPPGGDAAMQRKGVDPEPPFLTEILIELGVGAV